LTALTLILFASLESAGCAGLNVFHNFYILTNLTFKITALRKIVLKTFCDPFSILNKVIIASGIIEYKFTFLRPKAGGIRVNNLIIWRFILLK
jgi:hypothetical protein